MARKTNTRTRVSGNNHPRSYDRGWLVLRARWGRFFKEFRRLVYLTLVFLMKKMVVWRKQKATLVRKIQSIGMIAVGIAAIGLWLNHWWAVNAAEQANRKALLQQQLAEVRVVDKPHPTHIYIQWFVDAPVIDGTLAGDTWTLSDTAAVYLIQSARPNTPGNIVIYGHNTREMMGNIRALKGREKIKLTLSDGSERWYQVKTMRQVPATAVSYIQPTETETLTLYTCAGFADTQRFVVQAIPIDDVE